MAAHEAWDNQESDSEAGSAGSPRLADHRCPGDCTPAGKGTGRIDAHSQRIEVAVENGTLRVWRGLGRLPKAVRNFFDDQGEVIAAGDPEDVVAALERLRAGDFPELRISQDVGPWLDERRAVEERRALRRTYEQKVQGGEWPPHETLVPLFPYQREGML